MLYIANWGTKQLMFRLPRSVTDVSGLDRYCFPRIITTSVTKVSVILDICFQEEKGGYWVEGEGQLSALKYPVELTDLRWKERITLELNDGQLPARRSEFDSSYFLILTGISQDFRDYQFLDRYPNQASINDIHEAIEHFVWNSMFDL